MITDENGLPVQRDFDAGDQLNRVGTLATMMPNWYTQLTKLRLKPGVYVRFVGANPNNVSGDQLVPVFGAALRHDSKEFRNLVFRMFLRLGFAQNTHDTDGTFKGIPDFLLPRVIPFIARAYLPACMVCPFDILLVLQTLLALFPYKTMDDKFWLYRKTPDDVDQDVNLVNTLYVCNMKKSTSLSRFAALLYEENRARSFGGEPKVDGALWWYHRAEAKGNPEIGAVQIKQWRRTLAIAYKQIYLKKG